MIASFGAPLSESTNCTSCLASPSGYLPFGPGGVGGQSGSGGEYGGERNGKRARAKQWRTQLTSELGDGPDLVRLQVRDGDPPLVDPMRREPGLEDGNEREVTQLEDHRVHVWRQRDSPEQAWATFASQRGPKGGSLRRSKRGVAPDARAA